MLPKKDKKFVGKVFNFRTKSILKENELTKQSANKGMRKFFNSSIAPHFRGA